MPPECSHDKTLRGSEILTDFALTPTLCANLFQKRKLRKGVRICLLERKVKIQGKNASRLKSISFD